MKLEPLKLLNLRNCNSVEGLVSQMQFCSFGARMLSQVTNTLFDWVKDGKAVILFDGDLDSSLGCLLKDMVDKGWFSGVVSPDECCSVSDNVLVVGRFTQKDEFEIFKVKNLIFINQYRLSKPEFVKDGFFSNVVFCDPEFIIPLIYFSLLERIEGKKTSLIELMSSLKHFGGLAEVVAKGAFTANKMFQDPDCTVFLTLSGAMTVAKMGLLICDMIDLGFVNFISSTGALMAHGLIESVGLKHYKYNPVYDDAFLRERKLNRITDTLEPETNFDHLAEVVDSVLDAYSDVISSPSEFHKHIGAYLVRNFPGERGILKSAYEKNVPVIVPAFVDSELANDIFVRNLERKMEGKSSLFFDLEKDSGLLVDHFISAKKVGIFTIGGGVPRNNVQNVAPLVEIVNDRLGFGWRQNAFFYGVRICPDPMDLGHLSGCTYSEGSTWRKMDSKGEFVEVHADATIVWPFILKYCIDKLYESD